ncbi:alanine racemase [Streptomyces sp. NPDC001732]
MDHEMPRGGHPTGQLPELRLDQQALEHNVRLMAAWCRDHHVELTPHIKTTMTRSIVERQLAAGAWGVTVATVTQARIALGWGVRRVIIANEVVHRHDLSLLRRWLDEESELELYCFVDSLAGIGLAQPLTTGARTPLRVLIDIGTDAGRTGVKGPVEAADLAKAVRAAPGLLLAGVAGYEGVRPNRRDTTTLAAVDEHCHRAITVFRSLTALFETTQPVFSMGGSAFPDRVVHALAKAARHPDPLLCRAPE